MYAYFHKGEFKKFILNDDKDLRKRLSRAMGHKEKDVEVYRFRVQLRNDANYYFDENKDLVILREEEREVVQEVEGEDGVTLQETILQTVSIVDRVIEKEDLD